MSWFAKLISTTLYSTESTEFKEKLVAKISIQNCYLLCIKSVLNHSTRETQVTERRFKIDTNSYFSDLLDSLNLLNVLSILVSNSVVILGDILTNVYLGYFLHWLTIVTWQTEIIMGFVKEYTDLFPKGIWNCLFSEGPKALKEISCCRSWRKQICIFLIKTHDIRLLCIFI